MKLRLLILMFVFTNINFHSQDLSSDKKPVLRKSNLELNLIHNTASLFNPSFRVIHPGINTTLSTQWNNKKNQQLRQDFIAGFFYHRRFQSVIQLYSEFNFKIKVLNRFYFSPLVIGGGYFMSFINMQSFYWDGYQYVLKPNNMKNNWVISLGSNLEIPTNLKLFDRALSITAKYRLQVQGVIVRYNVPIIAYSPIKLGVSIPLNN